MESRAFCGCMLLGSIQHSARAQGDTYENRVAKRRGFDPGTERAGDGASSDLGRREDSK